MDTLLLLFVTYATAMGLGFALVGFGNIYLQLFGKPFLPT